MLYCNRYSSPGSAGGVCPAQPSNDVNSRDGHGWQWLDNGQLCDGDITVKCVTHSWLICFNKCFENDLGIDENTLKFVLTGEELESRYPRPERTLGWNFEIYVALPTHGWLVLCVTLKNYSSLHMCRLIEIMTLLSSEMSMSQRRQFQSTSCNQDDFFKSFLALSDLSDSANSWYVVTLILAYYIPRYCADDKEYVSHRSELFLGQYYQKQTKHFLALLKLGLAH